MKAKGETSSRTAFLDLHTSDTFQFSKKIGDEKDKKSCNLLHFSLGFNDEGVILCARVLETDEKKS